MANYDVEVLAITDIQAHPNADTLDIAYLGGWRSIVKRNSFSINDIVVYIHPDAVLNFEYPWVNNYAAYVSSRTHRVKTIKLRQVFSEGIIVKIDYLKQYYSDFNFTVNTDPIELAKLLGITHFEIPDNIDTSEVLSIDLPYNLSKTDQTNIQQLNVSDVLGRRYMITRKKDGSSCTITCDSNLNITISSRSFTYQLTATNQYVKAAKPIIDALTEYVRAAKARALMPENCVLVLRGEICGEGIQQHSFNNDSTGIPKFYLFEAYILNTTTYEIVRRFTIDGIAFILGIDHVPILGEITSLTEEMINTYLNAPATDGEGVVLWELEDQKSFVVPTGYSFKIRSKEYDALM